MIFCDLDGVLADFNKAFFNLTGHLPDDVSTKTLWTTVLNTPDYWLNLELMPDAHQLIQFLKAQRFTVLTGIPRLGNQKAETEKRLWVTKHLGQDIPVICCYSADKKQYCRTGDILIDDYPPNIQDWTAVGGTAVHHTSATNTVRQLKDLGF